MFYIYCILLTIAVSFFSVVSNVIIYSELNFGVWRESWSIEHWDSNSPHLKRHGFINDIAL